MLVLSSEKSCLFFDFANFDNQKCFYLSFGKVALPCLHHLSLSGKGGKWVNSSLSSCANATSVSFWQQCSTLLGMTFSFTVYNLLFFTFDSLFAERSTITTSWGHTTHSISNLCEMCLHTYTFPVRIWRWNGCLSCSTWWCLLYVETLEAKSPGLAIATFVIHCLQCKIWT